MYTPLEGATGFWLQAGSHGPAGSTGCGKMSLPWAWELWDKAMHSPRTGSLEGWAARKEATGCSPR